MFHRIRDHWAPLLGTKTAYPAPTVGAPEEMEALRRSLEDWHARDARRFRRLFLEGRAIRAGRRDGELFDAMESRGLVTWRGTTVHAPCVRLFPFLGRFVATDLLAHAAPDQVFSLMFEQVYLARNLGTRASDEVLELCTGSGAIALKAAETARRVTAVDLNPRALAFARFNAALAPPEAVPEFHEGSLFEPLEPARRFDRILVNPPFEPVPPRDDILTHSAGGADGLALIRRLLDGVADRLTPDGRLVMITWSPGTETGPLVAGLWRMALPGHRLAVHVLGEEPIGPALERFTAEPTYEAWRAHLRDRGLTRLYFVFLASEPSANPGMEFPDTSVESDACARIASDWC